MRRILALFVMLHGLIHLLGLPLAWGGTVAGMAGETLIPLGGVAQQVAGIAWLVTSLGLLGAALGLALGRDWWRPVALVAVVVSQVLIVLWWADARAGTLANLLLLAGAIWRPGIAARRFGMNAGV